LGANEEIRQRRGLGAATQFVLLKGFAGQKGGFPGAGQAKCNE
jgi:hypothetical protein